MDAATCAHISLPPNESVNSNSRHCVLATMKLIATLYDVVAYTRIRCVQSTRQGNTGHGGTVKRNPLYIYTRHTHFHWHTEYDVNGMNLPECSCGIHIIEFVNTDDVRSWCRVVSSPLHVHRYAAHMSATLVSVHVCNALPMYSFITCFHFYDECCERICVGGGGGCRQLSMKFTVTMDGA